MSINPSQVLAALAAGASLWLACRWWYMRHINRLRREMSRYRAAHDSAVQLGQQARKQVQDLQRMLGEYRKRLEAVQASRPPRTVPVSPRARLEATEPPPPRRLPPGGWADTRPM